MTRNSVIIDTEETGFPTGAAVAIDRWLSSFGIDPRAAAGISFLATGSGSPHGSANLRTSAPRIDLPEGTTVTVRWAPESDSEIALEILIP
jgi:hypothetical protein